jgi:photosystem II stability/assembly factor-like uncharacterized protein
MAKLHFFLSFLFLSLVCQTAAFSQGSWERVDVPSGKFFSSVCFTDSLYGWVVGDSGTILHTSDGGTTWSIQQSNTTNDIVSVFFLDRNMGWASSYNYTTLPYGTLLLKTENGGLDWTGIPYPQENIFITCILFTDPMTGWMGGKPHALVKTVNGGAGWVQAAIDTSILAFFPVLGIKFYNKTYGFACGGMFDIAGVTWRTSDGGNTWAAMDASDAPADEVHQLHIFDSLHVMGAGGDPDFGFGVGLLRTSDGGMNWDYEELGVQGTAYDIAFRNHSEVWAPLGPRRKLIRSMDGGTSWAEMPSPDSTAIYKMVFPDSLHGYAVGAEGAFLRFRHAGNLAVPPGIAQPGDFALGQNYPNPFDRATTIRFTVPAGEARFVRIRVSDVFGYTVMTLVKDYLSPGDNETVFDAAGLPAGIYLYQMEILNEGRFTKAGMPMKMILLK